MNFDLLRNINSPEELKRLDEKDVPALCSEIREFLIEKVEKSGGHLASNLGVTELTVALHRIFDSPNDKIIFDVGHQSYVHKILTGRRDDFDGLRTTGGLCAFTSMRESPHDAFGAGHSSTSVSAALGYAEAAKINSSPYYTVAVFGDGAFTGGMLHEALNNCDPDLKLILILNENGMSISVNKGRFASYLSGVRSSDGYLRMKKRTKSILAHIPLLGRPIAALLNFLKEKFKSIFLSSNYFEDLGLYYMGPIDGNDYKKVERALQRAKELSGCVVLHLKTVKGKGYPPAEKSPDGFHSVGASAASETFHSVFTDELIKRAEQDADITAITAAMGIGTGFERFGERFPDRYFDVGIAEEHALTFSAGLAAAGLKPYVGIYSTFLQRGYDSIIHDICLQNLPVRLIIDRASLSKGDGATHHGLFDVAFLSHIPNMRILAPASYSSLKEALDISLDASSPIAIRYPNSDEISDADRLFNSPFGFGIKLDFDESLPPEYVFITYGTLLSRVLSAEKLLKDKGISVGTVLLEELKPYKKSAQKLAGVVKASRRILFAEEGIKNGGAGMLFGAELACISPDIALRYAVSAVDDNFASPTEPCELYESVGLSPEKLAEKMLYEG